jgi:hypothetical protein
MSTGWTVAILGATGAVGRAMSDILAELRHPKPGHRSRAPPAPGSSTTLPASGWIATSR